MSIIRTRSAYVDYILMIIGAGLMAFVIKSIYDPINLVTGGFTGVAIIVKAITGNYIAGGIPLWLTNLVLNIPSFLLALKIKGIRFLGRTIFATFCLSAWLYLLPGLNIMTHDFVLASLFGGVLTGVGVGLVLLGKGTTGGTDMLAVLIQHYKKHYTVAQILQAIDALVVIAGAFLFGLNRALYAVISIYIVSQITDGILEGLKFSKIAYIITDMDDEVANAIMDKLGRGATGIKGQGMYSKKQKGMLFCVVAKKQIVELKEIVIKVDPKAFVIVSDAREVLGEGFIEYKI